MRYLEVNLDCRGNDKPFDLGYEGENIVTGVIFDYSSWRELYGVGALTLAVQPSGNSNPYPVTLTAIDDTHALWTLTKTDLNEEGAGRCQLTYVVGEAIKKSAVFVYKAGYSMDATGEIPDPYISYFEQILETGAQVQADAAAAAQAKADAETAAQDARASADEIENMTATAETLPAGSDATAEYSDGTLSLGIPQGAPGDEGPQGPPGPTGNGIQSTVLNADYTLTITFTDGTTYTTPSIRGPQGPDGETGPTGNGIQSTVLNADYTLTITFTDGTTYTTPSIRGEQGEQGDPGVVQDVTVNGTSVLDGDVAKITIPQITKTVTGNPITIDDADGEVKSLNVELTPIQDLHGYDKPWAAGAGRNLLNVGGRVNQTTAQVTYMSDDDYVILNGTKQGGGYANLTTLTITLPAGTYYAKAIPVSGIATANISVYPFDGSADVVGNIMDSEKSFTLSEEKTFYFRFAVWNDGTVFTNYTVGIVVSKTSGIDKFYPYENICPISPHTSLPVRDTGVNLFDKSTVLDGYISDVNGNFVSSTTRKATDFIRVFGGESYLIKTAQTESEWGAWYDENKNFIIKCVGYEGDTVKTAPANACYLRLTCVGTSSGNLDTFAVNYPSTDHDYHPYTGQTVTVPLNDLYGGTVDVTSGSGTEKYGYVDLGTLNYDPYTTSGVNYFFTGALQTLAKRPATASDKANIICTIYPVGTADDITTIDKYVWLYTNGNLCIKDTTYTTVADFKQAMQGVYLCYELQTYTDLTTTPTPLTLYKGDNVISSDGDITLNYERNLQAVITSIEDRLSALES